MSVAIKKEKYDEIVQQGIKELKEIVEENINRINNPKTKTI